MYKIFIFILITIVKISDSYNIDLHPESPLNWISTGRVAVSGRKYVQISISYDDVCESIANLANNQTILLECKNELQLRFEQPMSKLCSIK